MPPRLVPLNPAAAAGPAISLQRPVVLIGRHPECDARIDSPQVSRRHCCVALAYDRVMIRDLGSRNGLRVNGQVVEEAALQPGDEVAIAQYLYRLEESAAPPPRFAARPTPASAEPPPLPPGPSALDAEVDDLIPLDD